MVKWRIWVVSVLMLAAAGCAERPSERQVTPPPPPLAGGAYVQGSPIPAPGALAPRVVPAPRVIAAHRQYFDQRRKRYYFYDPAKRAYFWEDGTPKT